MASDYVYLPKNTLIYLSKIVPGINIDSKGVLQSDLDKIEEINIRDIDPSYLQYFRNIKTLVIDGTPDVDERIFNSVIRNCRELTSLAIKNQPRLKSIDITCFKKLKNLSIISNENLHEVKGLYGENSIVNNLDSLAFYDNVNYYNERELVEFISKYADIKVVRLDALYYIDYYRNKKDGNLNEEYTEKIGFRDQKNMSYSTGEMKVAYDYANSIIKNVIKDSDTMDMKIAVLYLWIIKNVRLSEERDTDINEGIVNVFKYRVSSYPTVAKYFQFLLKVAGIDSYDINVLPRIKFNNSKYGSYQIPSEDFEILMIKKGENNLFFDLAWDMDISNKIDREAVLFMFNGLDDIMYNHRLLYARGLVRTPSYDIEKRENIINKARKRLANVRNKRISSITEDSSDDYSALFESNNLIQDSISEYLNDFNNLTSARNSLSEELVEEKDNKKTKALIANIKKLDRLIEPVIMANNILRKAIVRLEDSVKKLLSKEDLTFIKKRLGFEVSPYKYIGNNRVSKSKEELVLESNRVLNSLNRELSNGDISISSYKIMKSKLKGIYSMLISFALESSVKEDNRVKGKIGGI